MTRVWIKLLVWLAKPITWIMGIIVKRMMSRNPQAIAENMYQTGMISEEQYEQVKKGELDLFEAAKEGYAGRRLVVQDGHIKSSRED